MAWSMRDRLTRSSKLEDARRFLAWYEADSGSNVKGKLRRDDQVRHRRIAIVVLREFGLSGPEIGRLLNRNHTTVLDHVRLAWSDESLLRDARSARARYEHAIGAKVDPLPAAQVTNRGGRPSMRHRDLELLRMVHEEGRPLRAVADSAGISERAVKQAMYRMRRRDGDAVPGAHKCRSYIADEAITQTSRYAREIQADIDRITAEVKASWSKPREARSSMIPVLESRLEELHAEKRAALALGLR